MDAKVNGVIYDIRTHEVGGTCVSEFAVMDCNGEYQRVLAWQNSRMPYLVLLKEGDKVCVKGWMRQETYMGIDGLPKLYSEIVATDVTLL